MTHAAGRDPDDPMRIGGVDRAPGTEGAEEVGAAEAEATQAVDAAASTTTEIDAIAQGLQSGAIDAAEAKAQLVEQAVQAQLPPDADPALVAEIRAEVEALLESDPVLEALLRP